MAKRMSVQHPERNRKKKISYKQKPFNFLGVS